MWRTYLYRELTSGLWAVRANYASNYQGKLDSFFSNGELAKPEMSIPIFITNASAAYPEYDRYGTLIGFPSAEKDSTAIINIVGPMTRYNGACSTGTETHAAIIRAAIAAPMINSILLNIDTPGGSTSSVFPLVDAMQLSNKPIVAYVNNAAFSAGYYVASYANSILANNILSEVGSIGVMAVLVDDTEAMAKEGYKRIYIYPSESVDKNGDYHKALAGDTQPMIENTLKPWAVQFQNVVKTNRGSRLRADVPGVLSGGEFYASDALNYGLIDGIASFEEAIDYAKNQAVFNNSSITSL